MIEPEPVEPLNVTLTDILPAAATVLLHGSIADVCAALDHTILGVLYADGPDIDIEWREEVLDGIHLYLALAGVPPARAVLYALAVELGCCLYDGIVEAFPDAEDSLT